MDYATVEQLAAYTRADAVEDADNLALAISAASRVIDRHCNSTFDDPIPAGVTQACLLQASRFFARRYSPFGIAGSPENGSELRLLSRVDPDVAVVLAPYRVWWGAV